MFKVFHERTVNLETKRFIYTMLAWCPRVVEEMLKNVEEAVAESRSMSQQDTYNAVREELTERVDDMVTPPTVQEDDLVDYEEPYLRLSDKEADQLDEICARIDCAAVADAILDFCSDESSGEILLFPQGGTDAERAC